MSETNLNNRPELEPVPIGSTWLIRHLQTFDNYTRAHDRLPHDYDLPLPGINSRAAIEHSANPSGTIYGQYQTLLRAYRLHGIFRERNSQPVYIAGTSVRHHATVLGLRLAEHGFRLQEDRPGEIPPILYDPDMNELDFGLRARRFDKYKAARTLREVVYGKNIDEKGRHLH